MDVRATAQGAERSEIALDETVIPAAHRENRNMNLIDVLARAHAAPERVVGGVIQYLLKNIGALAGSGEIGAAQIRDGLHIFGQAPQGEQMPELLRAFTRLSNLEKWAVQRIARAVAFACVPLCGEVDGVTEELPERAASEGGDYFEIRTTQPMCASIGVASGGGAGRGGPLHQARRHRQPMPSRQIATRRVALHHHRASRGRRSPRRRGPRRAEARNRAGPAYPSSLLLRETSARR